MNSTKLQIAKLSRYIANGTAWFIIWFIMFPVMVVGGILSILITKVSENKVDANTRVKSVESKILPKNTTNRNPFGYPDRSVRE